MISGDKVNTGTINDHESSLIGDDKIKTRTIKGQKFESKSGNKINKASNDDQECDSIGNGRVNKGTINDKESKMLVDDDKAIKRKMGGQVKDKRNKVVVICQDTVPLANNNKNNKIPLDHEVSAMTDIHESKEIKKKTRPNSDSVTLFDSHPVNTSAIKDTSQIDTSNYDTEDDVPLSAFAEIMPSSTSNCLSSILHDTRMLLHNEKPQKSVKNDSHYGQNTSYLHAVDILNHDSMIEPEILCHYDTEDELPLQHYQNKFSGTARGQAVENDGSLSVIDASNTSFHPRSSSSPIKWTSYFSVQPSEDALANSITDSEDEIETNSTSESQKDDSDVETNECQIEWLRKTRRIKKPTFLGPEPGPVHTLNEQSNELRYFHQCFPEDFYDNIANASNSYATLYKDRMQKERPGWDDEQFNITADDIKAYFGIRMIMAIDRKSNVEDYWSDCPALTNKFIKDTMPRQFYKKLQRYFHIMDPNETEEQSKDDPLAKVRDLLKHLLKQCQDSYNLHQQISVDEAMVKCHAKHFGIFGAPNKPAKRSFKIFGVADGISGYLSSFEVYLRGKKEMGLTQHVVERLVQSIQN